MTDGMRTSEFWFLVAVTVATICLSVYIIEKEGTSGLINLAAVLPFIFGGAGWYHKQRNNAKANQ